VTEKPATSKTAEESATEALKAENARLQEKLAALLSPGAKKTEVPQVAAKITAAQPAENKAAETAGKAPDAAHLDASVPPVPTKNTYTAPVIAPIANAPAPPPAASAKPTTPAKISSFPLPAVPKEEQIKIPSWLEPLARNAAISAPPEDVSEDAAVAQPAAGSNPVFEEPVPDANWLNKLVSHQEPPQIAEESSGQRPDLFHDELSSSEAFQQNNAPDSAQDGTQDGTQANQQDYADVAAPTFGSRLLLDDAQAGEEGAPKSKKALIAAVAATILLAAGGGYWYTHQGTATPAVPQRAAQSSPVAQQSAQPPAAASVISEPQRAAANTTATGRPAGPIVNQAVTPAATPAALNTNMVVTPNHASQPTSSSPVSTAANSAQPLASQPAAVQPKRPTLGEVHLAAPTVAHTNNAGAATDADPSIGLNGSAAPAVTNLDEELAPTSGPAAPKAPIPVGGDVKSAQLLKSVPPVYPPFARTQRVGGDVKIDALIDATGKVTTMKAVSGPTLLHQAAMDALRQWKYQPATLDGKAVAMHLTVTIQFRLQ
jgi:TonB family protein